MTISLTPGQQAWINVRVARGDFASAEEAARQLIDERIAERTLEDRDDLGWAKPYVDEALAEVAGGDVISREGHRARNGARLATLKE
jgi:antitoxin ParD1/3/4